MTIPKWQFASRFSRAAFGWKSTTPILHIKEALTEIKVHRHLTVGCEGITNIDFKYIDTNFPLLDA